MKRIPFKVAIFTILIILSAVIVFHVMILLGLIPYDMVWGGRLTSHQQMVQYEISSLFINLCMIMVVAMKGGLIKLVLPAKIITVFLWVFAFVFTLNTVGNLMAFNSLETYIFTPVTFVLVILFSRVALEKNNP